MNYIAEINSFHEYISMNPLNGATQSMWFYLMNINNKCNWIEWFNVSNIRLGAGLCMSEKTLIKHREILIENGLIYYNSQKKKKNSGEYKMISIYSRLSYKNVSNSSNLTIESTGEIPVGSEATGKTTGEIPVGSEATGKTTGEIPVGSESTGKTTGEIPVGGVPTGKIPDITKQVLSSNSTTTIKSDFENQELETVVKFFKDNFYEIGSYEINQFKTWLKEFNSDVIILALEESIKSGVKNYKYIEGILKNWRPLNLKTVDEIKGHMASFSSMQNPNNNKVTSIGINNKFHNFNQRSKKYTNEELEIKLGIRK